MPVGIGHGLVLDLTGAIIAIESLAMLVGARIVLVGQAWCTWANRVLAALDIAGAIWLVALALRGGWVGRSSSVIPALLLLVTHAYREWEYLVGATSASYANLPLFVFNNLRLADLVAVRAISWLVGPRQ